MSPAILRPALSAVCVLACMAASGCAWLFGQAEPSQLPQPFVPAPLSVTAEATPLRLTATFMGLGDRVVARRNLWGRIATVVNAYGDDTLVFRLVAENVGEHAAVLLPQKATLRFDEREPVPARTLDEYRHRWPTWAVTTSDEGTERMAAYSHVADTLLIERVVAPGRRVEGRLAFPAQPAIGPMVLVLPYRVAFEPHEARLSWRLP